MKKVILTTSIAALAMAFQASAADSTALVDKLSNATCKEAAHLVAMGMTTNSEIAGVTVALETGLAAKPDCACDIVKEVIAATGADAESKQAVIEAIVETALLALPEETATITECAVAAAPAHAAAIEKVLERVFADKDKEYLGDSSKQRYSKQGKQGEYVEEEVEMESDFPVYALPAPVYLIAPSGGIVPPGLFERPGVSPADPHFRRR